MTFPTTEMSPQSAPAEIGAFVSRVLASCLEIRSVWSIDHRADEPRLTRAQHALLAFADAPTLERLRRCEHLHRSDVEFLVVIDGDLFESAWGPRRLSGSLARWAWRQISPHEAYYDESRWAQGEGDAGTVVRVRRKAFVVWETQPVAVH
jgi:hypothetical protein